MKKLTLLILVTVLSALTATAQIYKVGEKVEFECNDCFGRSGWVGGTIEKVSGETYQIRYGTEPRQFRTGIPIRLLREGDFAQKENKRRQFLNEASVFQESVFGLMQIHNPNLRTGNGYYEPPTSGAEWAKLKSNLIALDNLCKTKYAGMTNGRPADETNLFELPATWCEIAAKRNEYQAKGLEIGARNRYKTFLQTMVSNVQNAINDPNGYIDENIQLLMYERDKWRAIETPKFQKGFTELGMPMPSDFFRDVETKADELKAQNERLAPNRNFLMPKHRDAAVEAFVRGRYAALKKGVQILKLGLDDANWIIHRNSLGIPTSQTKVARLLVKVPNRPFCQEHSIAAERKYLRGSYGAMNVDGGVIGAEGLFMKCE